MRDKYITAVKLYHR